MCSCNASSKFVFFCPTKCPLNSTMAAKGQVSKKAMVIPTMQCGLLGGIKQRLFAPPHWGPPPIMHYGRTTTTKGSSNWGEAGKPFYLKKGWKQKNKSGNIDKNSSTLWSREAWTERVWGWSNGLQKCVDIYIGDDGGCSMIIGILQGKIVMMCREKMK